MLFTSPDLSNQMGCAKAHSYTNVWVGIEMI